MTADAGLPADHPSVHTVRAHLQRYGPGLRLLAPAEEREAFAVGDVVRVVVAGSERFGCARTATDDAPFFPGLYDTPDVARDPASAADPVDRLGAWAGDCGLGAGDPVLVDVLTASERYGLREPGDSVTYRQRRQRDDSLAAIARDLDG